MVFSCSKTGFRLGSLALAAAVALSSLPAQADAPKAYFEIEEDKGFALVVNGKAYSPSFWSGFAEAEEAFADNAKAHELYKSYGENLKAANLASWGGLGVGFGVLALSASGTIKMSADATMGVYFGALLGGLATSLYFQSAANFDFWKAINHYNGVYEPKRLTQNSPSRWIPRMSFVGLSDGSSTKPAVEFSLDL